MRDVGCSGFEMCRMWDVRDVRCSGCGMFEMWDVDLQNAIERHVSLIQKENITNSGFVI